MGGESYYRIPEDAFSGGLFENVELDLPTTFRREGNGITVIFLVSRAPTGEITVVTNEDQGVNAQIRRDRVDPLPRLLYCSIVSIVQLKNR
eukprot:g15130.t1